MERIRVTGLCLPKRSTQRRWPWRYNFRTFIVTLAVVYFLVIYASFRTSDIVYRNDVITHEERGNQRKSLPFGKSPYGNLAENRIFAEPVAVNASSSLLAGEVPGWQGIGQDAMETRCRWGLEGQEPPDRFLQITAHVHVYSAYWDERPNDFDNINNGTRLRIMAIVEKGFAPDLFCAFSPSSESAASTDAVITPVQYYEMCENHNKQRGAYILSCDVPPRVQRSAPCTVNITADRSSPTAGSVTLRIRTLLSRSDVVADNVVAPKAAANDAGTTKLFQQEIRPLDDQNNISRVERAGERRLEEEVESKRFKFTVCVPPLFGSVPVARLAEFVAVTSALGADRIVFYTMGPTEALASLLQKLVSATAGRSGRVSGLARINVIPWLLSRNLDDVLWYHGQSVAIQDCLYRHMSTSEFVVFIDIDEYIVPQTVEGVGTGSSAKALWHGSEIAARNETAWSQMLLTLDQPSRCAFQFESFIFFEPHTDVFGHKEENNKNTRTLAVAMPLETLTVFDRSSTISVFRTKCIVKPSLIFEAGIHHVSKPIWANLETFRVKDDFASVHHYRLCEAAVKVSCDAPVLNKRMLLFRELIEKNIQDIIKYAEE